MAPKIADAIMFELVVTTTATAMAFRRVIKRGRNFARAGCRCRVVVRRAGNFSMCGTFILFAGSVRLVSLCLSSLPQPS